MELGLQARLSSLTPMQRANASPVPEDFLPPKPSSDGIFDDLIGCKYVRTRVVSKIRNIWRCLHVMLALLV